MLLQKCHHASENIRTNREMPKCTAETHKVKNKIPVINFWRPKQFRMAGQSFLFSDTYMEPFDFPKVGMLMYPEKCLDIVVHKNTWNFLVIVLSPPELHMCTHTHTPPTLAFIFLPVSAVLFYKIVGHLLDIFLYGTVTCTHHN